MYSNTARKYSSSAASSLLRSSSSVSRPLASASRTAPHQHAPSRPGLGSSSSSICNQQRYSSTLRSLPRWSHRVDWKSPISLTAQIRTAAPALNQFHRKLATMGGYFCLFT